MREHARVRLGEQEAEEDRESFGMHLVAEQPNAIRDSNRNQGART